jgi:hypothetical protein
VLVPTNIHAAGGDVPTKVVWAVVVDEIDGHLGDASERLRLLGEARPRADRAGGQLCARTRSTGRSLSSQDCWSPRSRRTWLGVRGCCGGGPRVMKRPSRCRATIWCHTRGCRAREPSRSTHRLSGCGRGSCRWASIAPGSTRTTGSSG